MTLDPAVAMLAEHADAMVRKTAAQVANVFEQRQTWNRRLTPSNDGRTLLAAALRVAPTVRVLTHDQR